MSESNPNQPTEKAMARAKEILPDGDTLFLAAMLWNKTYNTTEAIVGLLMAREKIAHLIDEKEREKRDIEFKWDHESCSRCGYMRSPVAPCKCGQLVNSGTNDRLRIQLTTAEARIAELEARNKELEGIGKFLGEQRAELEGKLKEVLASATPHPTEYPTMFKAWESAKTHLAKGGQ